VEEKLTCRKTYEAPRVAGEVARCNELHPNAPFVLCPYEMRFERAQMRSTNGLERSRRLTERTPYSSISRRRSKRIRERQGERPPSAALARACRIAKTRRTMSGAGRVARPWI